MAKEKLLTPLELLRFRRSQAKTVWEEAIACQMIASTDMTGFVFKKKKDGMMETLEDTHPEFYTSLVNTIALHLSLHYDPACVRKQT